MRGWPGCQNDYARKPGKIPALGLRGLGMVGVSSGLHSAPFAGSQSGLRACFFGYFYPRHRLQYLVDGIIICKRQRHPFAPDGVDLTIGLQERRHVLPAILRDPSRIRNPVLPVACHCLPGGFRVRV